MAAGQRTPPPADGVRVDGIVLGALAAVGLAAFAALPAGLAGQVAAGVAVAGAIALGAVLVGRALPLGRDHRARDPLWAALGIVALAVVLLADLGLSDGKAVLIVGVITVVGSLVAYHRRLDDRRRAVAVALTAEIRVNAEATWLGLAPEVMAVLTAKPEGFKPYAVPVPPDYPVYVGNQEALGLLPAAAVRAVVSFYESDEFMTQAYNALGTDAFHGLARERQNQLYAHITERMEGEYLPTARRALTTLAEALGEAPDLPAFLAGRS